jgi:hypothetical protein
VIPLASVALALATPGLADGQGFSAALRCNPSPEEKEMTGPRFIEIEGKRILWRDLLKLRREQKQACANARQPALFELIEDRRPPAERTAAGRYLEPTLFALPVREG